MEALNPLDWSAAPFLTLYVVFAGAVLLLLQVERHRLGTPTRDIAIDRLDTLHLAYLSGGADRAANTALVGLLEAGAALPDRKRRRMRFDPSAPVPAKLQPFRHVQGGETDRSGFKTQFAGRWQRMHDDLARYGLVPGPAEVASFRLHGIALLCAPLLLGVCKVVVGLQRDRPVGILCVLLIWTVVFGGLLLSQNPHRNRAGTAALAAARRMHARAARAPLPEEMALAFALTGAVVLMGRDYRWVLSSGTFASGGDSGSSGDGGGGGGCGGCSG